MRGGAEKKHLRKKNIEPIFGKVNEGDQIKKTLDLFLEKLMRATKKQTFHLFKKKLMRVTKKQAKKYIAGIFVFISRNELGFFRNVFLSPEIDCYFSKAATF